MKIEADFIPPFFKLFSKINPRMKNGGKIQTFGTPCRKEG